MRGALDKKALCGFHGTVTIRWTKHVSVAVAFNPVLCRLASQVVRSFPADLSVDLRYKH